MEQEEQLIKFVSNRLHLTKDSPSSPKPIGKTLPTWYKEASVYIQDPTTNQPWVNPTDGGKVPNWKACAPIFDAMSSGYTLLTPCNIKFSKSDSRITAKALNPNCLDFISERGEMSDFTTPMGYDKHHFAWWVDWGIEVPEGYSVLYTQPMNRFELPFICSSGIVDNDSVHLMGQVPFFVFKDWEGTLPAGTPYLQVFPFKRENWKSELVLEDQKIMGDKNMENSKKYRVPSGGVYRSHVWQKRSYK